MKHIMLDLETLGSSPQAPIVQIGACVFDPTTGEVESSPFMEKVALGSDLNLFTSDIDTIEWWLGQSEEARVKVFGERDGLKRISLRSALDKFSQWHNGVWSDKKSAVDEKKIWSHATFDPNVLSNAYRVMNVNHSIRYKSFMDIRTLEYVTRGLCEKPIRVGTHHDALDDCLYQAAYVSKMLNALKQKILIHEGNVNPNTPLIEIVPIEKHGIFAKPDAPAYQEPILQFVEAEASAYASQYTIQFKLDDTVRFKVWAAARAGFLKARGFNDIPKV